jgi:hypothetical protein
VIDPSDYYRTYARIAADMARETTHPGHCASLLEMAQVWRKLADKHTSRVARHQPQPQPDDDKKERSPRS